MIKAVIDTNTIVSGSISSLGPSSQIIKAMISGKFKLITSEEILEEIERVFSYPKILSENPDCNSEAFY